MRQIYCNEHQRHEQMINEHSESIRGIQKELKTLNMLVTVLLVFNVGIEVIL